LENKATDEERVVFSKQQRQGKSQKKETSDEENSQQQEEKEEKEDRSSSEDRNKTIRPKKKKEETKKKESALETEKPIEKEVPENKKLCFNSNFDKLPKKIKKILAEKSFISGNWGLFESMNSYLIRLYEVFEEPMSKVINFDDFLEDNTKGKLEKDFVKQIKEYIYYREVKKVKYFFLIFFKIFLIFI